MAKPFYSIQEVCDLLGRDVDGVRALVREGKLREFRDTDKIYFKVEDVEKLRGAKPAADSGEITLEAIDELPRLDSGGTSVIGLAPIDEETETPKKSGTVLSSAGIGVFDDEELEIDADPMADTQIRSAPRAAPAAPAKDQASLEGTGSGSGLLDLTRESDDTSLGAELLDEIYPGEEEPTRPAARAAASEPEEAAEEPEALAAPAAVEPVFAPVVVAGDPTEGFFAGLLAGTALLLTVGGSVVGGLLQGYVPDYAQFLSNKFWFFLGGAGLVMLIAAGVGFMVGRPAGGPVRR